MTHPTARTIRRIRRAGAVIRTGARVTIWLLTLILAAVVLGACGRVPTEPPPPPPFIEVRITCTLTALTDTTAVSSCVTTNP